MIWSARHVEQRLPSLQSSSKCPLQSLPGLLTAAEVVRAPANVSKNKLMQGTKNICTLSLKFREQEASLLARVTVIHNRVVAIHWLQRCVTVMSANAAATGAIHLLAKNSTQTRTVSAPVLHSQMIHTYCIHTHGTQKAYMQLSGPGSGAKLLSSM
jgi:hypothetical protein